jgi:hypothetical protein
MKSTSFLDFVSARRFPHFHIELIIQVLMSVGYHRINFAI